MEYWAKIFFGKITPKLVQNTFGQFGNDFGHFWKFEKFLVFLQRHFEDSTLHGTLGKKFFRKNYPENMFKTRLDGFWERFSAFLEIWNFFDFLKTFRRLDPPWNTGQKNFSKKIPQNKFKTRLDTFGNDCGHFWKFWNIFDFLKTFRRLDPPWNTGQKKVSKKVPQNMFKTRLRTFGNDFGVFCIFESFWFFKNISKTRPSMQHCAKRNFRKKYPKTCSKHFWTIWERFWAFLEFWKFFDFLKTFGRLDPPWNTGQKKFSKKLPQNMFKTRLDNLGTILGIFGNLKNF